MTDIDSILIDWHWYSVNKGQEVEIKPPPLFKQAVTSKGWDSVGQIIDAVIENDVMEAVDFQISELCDVYRTALQITARNLALGWHVWSSPRLPDDKQARLLIVREAKDALTIRLRNAGVM